MLSIDQKQEMIKTIDALSSAMTSLLTEMRSISTQKQSELHTLMENLISLTTQMSSSLTLIFSTIQKIFNPDTNLSECDYNSLLRNEWKNFVLTSTPPAISVRS
jgi:hypothetical protein